MPVPTGNSPVPSKGNKLKRFKTNGYAKSYTPKISETPGKTYLKQLKSNMQRKGK